MSNFDRSSTPVRIGLVGTGYAARARAEALQKDERARLVAVAGHTLEKTIAFGETFGLEVIPDWKDLILRPDLDLIIVATVNGTHKAIVGAALEAYKHVAVEYPLALNAAEAAELIALASAHRRLLHVEHIELLSGVHQAIVAALPEIGTPFYLRYSTITAQQTVDRWTYRPDLFGFPLVGALSRLHRLTCLFGSVESVTCQTRYWSTEGQAVAQWHDPTQSYAACICMAQLHFTNGLLADVTYGKGKTFWQSSRPFEIHGDRGTFLMDSDQAQVIQGDRTLMLDLGSRRGLFAQDSAAVLAALTEGQPLYTRPESSLDALKVAEAAQRSAETGEPMRLG